MGWNGLTVGTRVGGAERPEISTAPQTVFALVLSACVLAHACMLACFARGSWAQWAEKAPRDGGCSSCWLLAAGCLRGMQVAWRGADRSRHEQSLSRAHAKAKAKTKKPTPTPCTVMHSVVLTS
jgi:hypothetical protein